MTTIFKLLLAALLLNAAAQTGLVAYKSFSFEDGIHEILLMPQATDADITARIQDLAEDDDVPLEAANIRVTRTQNEVTATVSYDEGIKLVPGLYTKVWTFAPSTSARLLGGISAPQKPPRKRP